VPSRFVSERLASQHDLGGFASGVESLDRWLADHAIQAQSMRSAQTFVWHRGDNVVVAYFSLAAHLVIRADLPRRVGRGSPEAIPAVLLARLALGTSLHGEGVGGELLWDAISRARAAADTVAARLVVVDAISPQAASPPSPDLASRLRDHVHGQGRM
jgi:hypothetical protein